jgi:YVTN family beta-propeller protein
VGDEPTGVAVDAAGKVWVTNYFSDNAMRIDPTTNAVDATVDLGTGAGPYNYSDMTGSTLIAPPNTGTWTVVHDSTIPNAVWGFVTWTASTPLDSSLQVYAASSTDGVIFSAEQLVTNGVDLTVPDGQYLRVRVQFNRAATGESPILYDLSILANRPPDCSQAAPSQGTIWPANHKFVPITVLGVTDPDGNPVTITINKIYQDEPVNTVGDGNFTPDGKGLGTSTAEVRAERVGTPKVPGNGRFYHIYFTATDPYYASCSGEVLVAVPHDQAKPPVDGGPLYDSTVP